MAEEVLGLDVQLEQLTCQHEVTHHDQHRAGPQLNRNVVPLEEPKAPCGYSKRDRREQERNRQPHRVADQQQRALGGPVGSRSQPEDRPERRADARCPRQRERGTRDDWSAFPSPLDQPGWGLSLR